VFSIDQVGGVKCDFVVGEWEREINMADRTQCRHDDVVCKLFGGESLRLLSTPLNPPQQLSDSAEQSKFLNHSVAGVLC
jgi:hypothetical protein